MNNRQRFDSWRRAALVSVVLCAMASVAQQTAVAANPSSVNPPSAGALADAVRTLSQQVRELQSELQATTAEMHSESEKTQAQTRELRQEVERLRSERQEVNAHQPEKSDTAVAGESVAAEGMAGNAGPISGSLAGPATEANLNPVGQAEQRQGHASSAEEEFDLLSGKIDDQYQTKVESTSKYRMRISGIVLMNAFSNQGTVDSIDIPALAYSKAPGQSGGSFGATLRQSELGFEVFGPRVASAKTTGDLQLDFAGGFPSEPNGVNSGLIRLRTATLRMDWEQTSIVGGQDGLFFSPISPTSFATLAVPALSYAGNLWSWVPQIRVEHKVEIGEASNLILQGGILDPVSGEAPSTPPYRQPGPGEASRQPAYGARTAWSSEAFGQPVQLGVGGFYSRQDYGFGRNVDAWAVMSDVEVPLGNKFAISGKVYRGRALGGLYGGIGQSVLLDGSNAGKPDQQIIGLNSVGGWAQFKYRAARKLEFNTAFGMDNPFARDLSHFGYPLTYGGDPFTRNRAGFANVIYRPRSDLLLSAEYRQLETNTLYNGSNGAGHLNLAAGVLF